MRSRLLRSLSQAYIGQGLEASIPSPLLLEARQQLGIRPSIGILYSSSFYSSSSSSHGADHKAWWSATAGVLSAGLALTAACAPAEADSSSTQMQQTHAAARAAQRTGNYTHSSYSSSSTGPEDNGYLQESVGVDSPGGNVLESISHAAASVTDVIQDLFHQAEARYAARTGQSQDRPM
jgi:hypothetical protein